MTPQEKLLRRIYACRFENWELKQEPHGESLLMRQKKLAADRELKRLTAEYEQTYGSLQAASETISRWAWTEGPFPH